MVWDGSTWMASVDGGKRLSELSIAGTHDTMTGHLAVFHRKVTGWAATQDQHLDEQLNRGIRYIDIRVKRIDRRFVCYHGSVYLDTEFRNVMIHCIDFLTRHPRETILMQLADEDRGAPQPWMEEIFHAYLAEAHDGRVLGDWFLKSDRVPTLDEARGRIVLVRRFGPNETLGINFDPWAGHDNVRFDIALPNAMAHIQDVYDLGMSRYNPFADGKWDHVHAMLKDARGETNRAANWYVNFTSEVGGTIPDPRAAMMLVAPPLVKYLKADRSAHVGTLVMDFPLEFGDLVELVCSRN